MAKVERTQNGYRVVHDITGMPLTGTFTGRGAKERAMARAREIRARNR